MTREEELREIRILLTDLKIQLNRLEGELEGEDKPTPVSEQTADEDKYSARYSGKAWENMGSWEVLKGEKPILVSYPTMTEADRHRCQRAAHALNSLDPDWYLDHDGHGGFARRKAETVPNATPVSEQVWVENWNGEVWEYERSGDRWFIYQEGDTAAIVAIVETEEMRDIILGIPALVKAGKEMHGLIKRLGQDWKGNARGYLTETLPNLQVTADLRDALEAMGLGE